MPNQENPSIHQLRVRVTEELFRALEVLAAPIRAQRRSPPAFAAGQAQARAKK